MMYARTLRFAAWFGVFAVPLFSAGYPLPYGVFALVPALASLDGVTARRALVWVGASLLYEFLYRVPLGTLSLAVVAALVIDVVARRGIRLDDRASRTSITMHAAVRCVLWVLVLLSMSALVGWLLYGASFSLTHMVALWSRPSAGGTLTLATVALFLLLNRFPSRAPEVRAW